MVRLAVVALVACGGGHARVPSQIATAGDEITLYRDGAFVHQRVDFDVAPGQLTTLEVTVAAGIEPDNVVIPDRNDLTIQELRRAEPMAKGGVAADEALATALVTPTRLQLVIGAPHAGHYAIHLAYITDKIAWDAAYTMTTTAARRQATLHGAVAIRNTTGIPFKLAHVTAIDAELGDWRNKTSELLGTKITGDKAPAQPVPRDLGTLRLDTGQSRIELLAGARPLAMRSVLVYDPIGTKLDNTGGSPIREPGLGVKPPAPTRVTESFEVPRDQAATAGLPAGPVRLLQRQPDGAVTAIGEARLFEAATRIADLDTIPIGTADGVIAHRERREITIDDDGKRIVEEFEITIDNARAQPVDVAIHEHLYRSQNWSLAYHSAQSAAKEGPQQIALRTRAPAKGQAKVLYVVVYTW